MVKDAANLIKTTDKKAQYDTCAKALLSHKIILAHILKETIEEFNGMDPDEIIPLIEGEPYISKIPVEAGMTNRRLENPQKKIIGSNTENTVLEEGTIYFDIIFYVRMRNGISQMIINIEAQKSSEPGYCVVNRAIYYTSRIISSQKERDFVKSNYDNIVRTYSIWICFNMNENCLNHIHLVDTPLVGEHKWAGDLNLVNIILVGLDKKATKASLEETENNLHYLLGTLFSNRLTSEEKIKLLDTRFKMGDSETVRKEMEDMCNLSYGILEEGIEQGIELGMKKGLANFVKEMLFDHQPYSLIRKYTGATDDEIKKIEESLVIKK